FVLTGCTSAVRTNALNLSGHAAPRQSLRIVHFALSTSTALWMRRPSNSTAKAFEADNLGQRYTAIGQSCQRDCEEVIGSLRTLTRCVGSSSQQILIEALNSKLRLAARSKASSRRRGGNQAALTVLTAVGGRVEKWSTIKAQFA